MPDFPMPQPLKDAACTAIHADIDWKRGYESLDTEFQQLIQEAQVGKRLADKLFKVWLKNGKNYQQII